MAQDKASRGDGNGSDKYHAIVLAAAELFAERGYSATSVRDIGHRVGLLGGSLYHHIKSKDALFLEIHTNATHTAIARIQTALELVSEPWERLEAACAEQLDIQLNSDTITRVLMEDFRAVPDETRAKLVAQRDSFEQIFAALVADLPLPAEIDRSLYRIFLLSILNNVPGWYRPGKSSPAEIAHQIVMSLRHDAAGRA